MGKQRLNNLQDLGKALNNKKGTPNKKDDAGTAHAPRPHPKAPPITESSPPAEPGDDGGLFAGAMAHVTPLGKGSRGKENKGSPPRRSSVPFPHEPDYGSFSLDQSADLEGLKKDIGKRGKRKKRAQAAALAGQAGAGILEAESASSGDDEQPKPAHIKAKVSMEVTAQAPASPPRESMLSPTAPAQSDEEDETFTRAMSGVAPLDKSGRQVQTPAPTAPAAARPTPEDVRIRLRELVEGQVEFDLEDTGEYVQGHVKGLDPRTMNLLKAGRISYEAHLDLHGLNTMQAYEALVDFLKKRYMESRRCVLLIPGRGRNSPEGVGVLRDKLQGWLTRDPFRRVVLAFCTAQQKHGGAGALYVLLRRYKKSRGKVQWDRYPSDPDLY